MLCASYEHIVTQDKKKDKSYDSLIFKNNTNKYLELPRLARRFRDLSAEQKQFTNKKSRMQVFISCSKLHRRLMEFYVLIYQNLIKK